MRIPDTSCEEVARLVGIVTSGPGRVGFEERCSHQCRRSLGKLGRTLPMIHQRHPVVACSGTGGRFTNVGRSQTSTSGTGGGQWICGAVMARVDSWLRPPREPEFHETGGPRVGWQHEAASCVERQFRTTSVPPLHSPSRRAMLRSRSGPAAGVAFSALPSSPLTRFQPALFRVLLRRRLALPLPLILRSCRCGRPLDAFGHHRAACSKSGVLGRRGFAVERAAARVCREAGARVATNLFVRDMDLGVPNGGDNSLPLFGGVQLAIDTTLVSAVQGDGEPTRGAASCEVVRVPTARCHRPTRWYVTTTTQGCVVDARSVSDFFLSSNV